MQRPKSSSDPRGAQRLGVGAQASALYVHRTRYRVSSKGVTAREDKISDREREVLKLLVAGRSNKEIGDEPVSIAHG